MNRIVLVPGALGLLPAYASRSDPLADVRRASLDAVAWLVGGGRPVAVAADERGARVAAYLLDAVGASPGGNAVDGSDDGLLVVGNGSACRTERSPGPFDERAEGFDKALGSALTTPDVDGLRGLDLGLGSELQADLTGITALAEHLTSAHTASVVYEGDPYGVQYWVMRWSCES